jgi:hypothetical protein
MQPAYVDWSTEPVIPLSESSSSTSIVESTGLTGLQEAGRLRNYKQRKNNVWVLRMENFQRQTRLPQFTVDDLNQRQIAERRTNFAITRSKSFALPINLQQATILPTWVILL